MDLIQALQPFSVTEKEPFYDWNKALSYQRVLPAAILKEMADLASSWVTCACGNQCAIIPRHGDCPDDTGLARLGGKFSEYIDQMESIALALSMIKDWWQDCLDYEDEQEVIDNLLKNGLTVNSPLYKKVPVIRKFLYRKYAEAQENAIICLMMIEEVSTIVIEETIAELEKNKTPIDQLEPKNIIKYPIRNHGKP